MRFMKNNTAGSFSDKMMEWVNRFANTKAILSLKDGFVLTMPITLIGSIFMLIGNFPVPGWENFMARIFGAGWQQPLNQVTGATFDIIALIAVFGIAYYWAKHSPCRRGAGRVARAGVLFDYHRFFCRAAGGNYECHRQ